MSVRRNAFLRSLVERTKVEEGLAGKNFRQTLSLLQPGGAL
jgi:hypothetical protein